MSEKEEVKSQDTKVYEGPLIALKVFCMDNAKTKIIHTDRNKKYRVYLEELNEQ